MKIKTITIENFKGISWQTVSFESNKVVALLGNNGKGKTSFIEALRYALTGVAPQNPIRDGEEYARVSVETTDGTTFSRTLFADGKPSKVIVNGRATPAKNLTAWLVEKFGFGTEVLKVTTNADVLMSMKSDALGDFLLQYVTEKLDVARVLGFIPDPTEEIQEAVLLALPDGKFTVEEVVEAYETFMEIRKKTKKDLELHKTELTQLPDVKPARTLPEIQKALEAVCNREGEAKAHIEAIRMYEAIVAERHAAIENVAELQKQFNAIEASPLDPLMRKSWNDMLEAANKAKNEAQSTMRIMQNTVKVFEDTLSKLATNHCPLSCNIVCTTDKTCARLDILAVIKDNNNGIAAQQAKIEAKEKEISALSRLIEDYDVHEKAYNHKLLLGEQILKVQKSIPELPSKPEHISSDDIDFEKEKSLLRDEMILAQKYEKRECLKEEIEKEKQQLETYNYLCKAFAPKGDIMTRILSSYLSIFEEEINKRALLLRTGIEVKFIPENGVKYLIKMKDEKGFRLYEELSEGEKTLAAFLLLDLVSSLCGTGIMVLDDLNHLDSGALHEIFNALTAPEFWNYYNHVIVASVNTSDILNVVKKYEADILTV